ncbi:MAG: tetratricopeptide repeat protein [bacterium]|nr:tetratricopeptide repeat protein [bacterium]
MKDVQDVLELGKFYFLNKKFQKAIELFQKIVAQEESNFEATYNLALSYEVLNELDSAKIFYEKTLEVKPSHKLAKEHLEKVVGNEK